MKEHTEEHRDWTMALKRLQIIESGVQIGRAAAIPGKKKSDIVDQFQVLEASVASEPKVEYEHPAYFQNFVLTYAMEELGSTTEERRQKILASVAALPAPSQLEYLRISMTSHLRISEVETASASTCLRKLLGAARAMASFGKANQACLAEAELVLMAAGAESIDDEGLATLRTLFTTKLAGAAPTAVNDLVSVFLEHKKHGDVIVRAAKAHCDLRCKW